MGIKTYIQKVKTNIAMRKAEKAGESLTQQGVTQNTPRTTTGTYVVTTPSGTKEVSVSGNKVNVTVIPKQTPSTKTNNYRSSSTPSYTTNQTTQYYGGVVTSVPSITKNKTTKVQLKNLQLKKIQIQRTRQNLQAKKILLNSASTPFRNINNQIKRAKQREYALNVAINQITKKQQLLIKKDIQNRNKNQVFSKEKLKVQALGIPKAGLKVVRDTQTLIKNLPELSRKPVLFVKDQPFNKVYNSIKKLNYKKIKSGVKISKKKLTSQAKSNPAEALTSGIINYFMLGGTSKGIRKGGKFLLTPEESYARAGTNKTFKKGLYLKVSKNEKPVLFKFKRQEGVTLRDVQNKITSKLTSLRQGKKLIIKSSSEKPLVVNMGNVKKPITKIKKNIPLTKIPKYKKTVLKTEGGSKITVIKNLNILRKQASKRLNDYKKLIKRKSIIVKGKSSRINRIAIKNLKSNIKKQKRFNLKINKLYKKLRKKQSKSNIKLAKKVYNKYGFKYPSNKSKLRLKFEEAIKNRKVKLAQNKFAKTTKYLEKKATKRQRSLNKILNKLSKKQSRKNIKLAKKVYKKYGLKFPTKKSKISDLIDRFKVRNAQRKYGREEKKLAKQSAKRYKKEGKYQVLPLKTTRKIQQLKTIKDINTLTKRIRDKSLSSSQREQLINLYKRFRNKYPTPRKKIRLSISTRTGKPRYTLTINGKRTSIKNLSSKFKNISSTQQLALKRFKKKYKSNVKSIGATSKGTGSIKVIRFANEEISQVKRGTREIGSTLKQIQIQKPISKSIRKKVYVINGAVADLEKSIQKLKKGKIRSKQALKQELKKINKFRFKVSPLLYEASSALSKQLNKQKTIQLIKQPSSSAQRLFTGTRIRTGQYPRQPTPTALTPKEAQKERQAFKTFLKTEIKQSKRKKKLRRLSGKVKQKQLSASNKKINVFNVYGKSGKKFIKLNKKPLTKRDALSKGAYAIDMSVSKKMKLVPARNSKSIGAITSREKNYFNKNKYKLREYKVRKGKKIGLKSIYIERRRYGIDTIGEKKGLTLAKLLNTSKTRTPHKKRSSFISSSKRRAMLKNLAKARRVLARNRRKIRK